MLWVYGSGWSACTSEVVEWILVRDGWKLPIVVALFLIVIGSVLSFLEVEDLREPRELAEPNDYLLLKLHWLSLPPYPDPS